MKIGVGDAQIITVRNSEDKSKIRELNILVDGGTGRKKRNQYDAYKNLKNSLNKNTDGLKSTKIKLNGIVVTHIDEDHINGILKLIKDDEFDEYVDLEQDFFVIFNDLVDPSTISYRQGEELMKKLKEMDNVKLVRSYHRSSQINANGFKLFISFEPDIKPPIMEEIDPIFMHILLPKKTVLREFMKNWDANITARHKNPKASIGKDSVVTNRTSIVFLLEYGGKSVLMTGDAYSEDIRLAVEEYKEKAKVDDLKVDVIKIPHHARNSCNKEIIELIEEVECKKGICSIEKITKNQKETIDKLNELDDFDLLNAYEVVEEKDTHLDHIV
jgi:hypothetical protein